MNKVTRRKLGLAQDESKIAASGVLDKISEITPITQNTAKKDYTSYSTLNLKTINIGTLRKPIEKLAIYDESSQGYVPIEIVASKNNPASYFSPQNYTISLSNSELLNYKTDLSIDQNNPYDPLFASFDRLYSLPAQTFIRSGVTGFLIGEKERYFNISSGFNRSTAIVLSSGKGAANRDINGTFVPTETIQGGRPRYLNASLAFPAAISYNSGQTGWFLSQTTTSGRVAVGFWFRPLYFLPGSGLPVGTGWIPTGSAPYTGSRPTPISVQKEFEGYFKLATTRKSNDKKRIYATPIGSTGILTGETSGSLPANNSWVTYPHTYNIESFTAFRYPVSFTFGNDASGLKDLVIISTGSSIKKIVYVSPHTIEQFQGFWSEMSGSSRAPKTGISGRVVSERPLWVLASGNLITVTSEYTNFTGLKFAAVSGVGGNSGIFRDLYNYESARLKQNVPLVQTPFYKLYEPIYKKNAINTGTWNGIIPSGVPFSIETVRTKDAQLVTPEIQVHAHQTFVNISPSGSGDYQFIRPFNYENLAGVGEFKGFADQSSNISILGAEYYSLNEAKKKAKAKLKGYLWEKGLTVDNHKVKQTVKLFGTKVTASGVNGEARRCQEVEDPSNPLSCSYTGTLPAKPRYCLPYENPSDPLSCSFTGLVRGAFGIPTSAGLRTLDQHSNVLPNFVDEEGNVIKFIPIIEN